MVTQCQQHDQFDNFRQLECGPKTLNPPSRGILDQGLPLVPLWW